MKIEEVKSVTRANRVAAHSHVKSLGLTEEGTATDIGGGITYVFKAKAIPTKNCFNNFFFEKQDFYQTF
jgi:DNA helicase TIP49 (TBP-interacting protein)